MRGPGKEPSNAYVSHPVSTCIQIHPRKLKNLKLMPECIITMAMEATSEDVIQPASAEEAFRVGHPVEQLELEENSTAEDINYPKGHKLWLTITSLCVAMFLKGLVCPYVGINSF